MIQSVTGRRQRARKRSQWQPNDWSRTQCQYMHACYLPTSAMRHGCVRALLAGNATACGGLHLGNEQESQDFCAARFPDAVRSPRLFGANKHEQTVVD